MTSDSSHIRIEFYGIARQRTETAEFKLTDPIENMTLGQVLRRLADEFPVLGDQCISDDQLHAGFVANLDGKQFVSDPNQVILPGQSVLIMSADAGG